MPRLSINSVCFLICCGAILSGAVTEARAQFKWSNPIVERRGLPDTVKHATFHSPSMGVEVGYCIYFPPDYAESDKHYSVVYVLHGGIESGDERNLLKIVPFLERVRQQDNVPVPLIYVFVNGGVVSFYNYPAKGCMAEDVFIEELIPHIDKTYRTVADRSGRGIEGYSGGGRATARFVFEYPKLFGSAIAGCGGFGVEKLISETGEHGTLKDFLPGHNAYDRAKRYSQSKEPAVQLLIAVGRRDRWYRESLQYMTFLDELQIPYDKVISPMAGHGATAVYRYEGAKLVQWHTRHLAAPQ